MSKVYIVVTERFNDDGERDYYISKVFSTMEKAEEYINDHDARAFEAAKRLEGFYGDVTYVLYGVRNIGDIKRIDLKTIGCRNQPLEDAESFSWAFQTHYEFFILEKEVAE